MENTSNRIVTYQIDEDTSVAMEVANSFKAEGTEECGVGDVVKKSKETFESALNVIKPLASKTITKIREMETPPSEVNVEFGLKIDLVGNLVVTSSKVESNINISMKWTEGMKIEWISGRMLRLGML